MILVISTILIYFFCFILQLNKIDKVYENLFGDYPELCQQIREGKLTLHDMKDIVHEYNVYKAGKSGKDK